MRAEGKRRRRKKRAGRAKQQGNGALAPPPLPAAWPQPNLRIKTCGSRFFIPALIRYLKYKVLRSSFFFSKRKDLQGKLNSQAALVCKFGRPKKRPLNSVISTAKIVQLPAAVFIQSRRQKRVTLFCLRWFLRPISIVLILHFGRCFASNGLKHSDSIAIPAY